MDSPQHNVSSGEFLPRILEPLTSLNKRTVRAPAAFVLQALAPEPLPISLICWGYLYSMNTVQKAGCLHLSSCCVPETLALPPPLPPPAFCPPPFHSTTVTAGGC